MGKPMKINIELLKNYKADNTVISLQTVGDSMLPMIVDGSTIFVKCCYLTSLHAGDVVVFFMNNSLVCHRCIKLQAGTFLERGDNCVLGKKLNRISEDALIGKVIGYCREGETTVTYTDDYPVFRILMRRIGLFSGWMATFNRKNTLLDDTTLKQNGLISRIIYTIFYCTQGREKHDNC